MWRWPPVMAIPRCWTHEKGTASRRRPADSTLASMQQGSTPGESPAKHCSPQTLPSVGPLRANSVLVPGVVPARGFEPRTLGLKSSLPTPQDASSSHPMAPPLGYTNWPCIRRGSPLPATTSGGLDPALCGQTVSRVRACADALPGRCERALGLEQAGHEHIRHAAWRGAARRGAVQSRRPVLCPSQSIRLESTTAPSWASRSEVVSQT